MYWYCGLLYNILVSLINELRKKFVCEEYEFSKHAVDESIIRDITVEEIHTRWVLARLLEIIPMIDMDQVFYY